MSTTLTPNDLTRQQLDELDRLLQRMLTLPLNRPEAPQMPKFVTPPLPEIPAVSGVWRMDTPAEPMPNPHLTPSPADISLAPAPSVGGVRPAASSPSAFAVLPPQNVVQTPPPFPPQQPTAVRYEDMIDPNPAGKFRPTTVDPASSMMGVGSTGTTGTLRGVDAPATPMGYVSAFADLPNTRPPGIGEVNPNTFANSMPFALPTVMPMTEKPISPVMWPLFGLNWLIERGIDLTGPLLQFMKLPFIKTMLGIAGILMILGSLGWAAVGMGWIPWPR